MALPAGPIQGNEITFAIDVLAGTTYAVIQCQRDLSIDIQSETIDAACKGTGQWGNILDGTKSTTISLSALFEVQEAPDTQDDMSDKVLFDALVASTRFTYQATKADAGNFIYGGTAILTGLTLNFPFNDVVSYDASMGGIGAITRTLGT